MQTHPIIFAGAGPGAPDLITVRGARALEQADYILYAGSLVPQAVLAWAQTGAIMESSAGLHLDQLVDNMALHWRQGKRVVRLHTGDPSLYGAIAEQMRKLDALHIPYESIPGVTAAFGAAAALQIEYTVPGQSQTLIFTRMAGRTPVPEKESLQSLAAHRAAMAIYLSAGMAAEVARILGQAYGAQAPCAIAYKVTHPEQQLIVTTIDKIADQMKIRQIDRHALILVGPFLASTGQTVSLLYDRQFAHGYRPA